MSPAEISSFHTAPFAPILRQTLIAFFILSLSTAILVTGCKTSPEHRLIGTWETGSVDAVWRMTFRPNHTLTLAFQNMDSGKFEPEVTGVWRLKGSTLTTELDFSTLPDVRLHRVKRTEVITFLGVDKIERAGGYPYTRLK